LGVVSKALHRSSAEEEEDIIDVLTVNPHRSVLEADTASLGGFETIAGKVLHTSFLARARDTERWGGD
jgi:hypothetical protein